MDFADLSEFQDDPEVLAILETFRSSVFPADLAALDDALERSDLDEVGRIAHRLNGSVGGYLSGRSPARTLRRRRLRE